MARAVAASGSAVGASGSSGGVDAAADAKVDPPPDAKATPSGDGGEKDAWGNGRGPPPRQRPRASLNARRTARRCSSSTSRQPLRQLCVLLEPTKQELEGQRLLHDGNHGDVATVLDQRRREADGDTIVDRTSMLQIQAVLPDQVKRLDVVCHQLHQQINLGQINAARATTSKTPVGRKPWQGTLNYLNQAACHGKPSNTRKMDMLHQCKGRRGTGGRQTS